MNKNNIELYEHNEKTFQDVIRFTAKGKDCCVVNPCGSGKSAVMAAIVQHYNDKRFLILTNQKNAASYYEGRYGSLLAGIPIMTYAKMCADVQIGNTNAYNADIYLMDEAHHVGSPKWSEAYLTLKNRYKPICIGFTATPQRFEDQGTEETIVTQYFSGNSAGNFTTTDLQQAGLFTEPEYVVSLYDFNTVLEQKLEQLEETDMPEVQKQAWQYKLQTALADWERNDSPEKVLSEHLPNYLYFEKGNKILVYVSDVSELEEKQEMVTEIVKKMFPEKTVRSYLYSYKHDDGLKEFESDNESYIRILFSINKIMETVHMDDLNILIMLRPSVSDRIITQQYGRVNNAKNPRRSLILDMVANIDNLGKNVSRDTLFGAENKENIQKEKMECDKKFSASLRPVSRYVHLFEEMDKASVSFHKYQYGGYKGSLSFLCKVFNKDISVLREMMQECTFTKAFEKTPVKKMNVTPAMMSGSITEYPDVTMPESNKQYLEKAMSIVDSFVCGHEITDEDVIQELYLDAAVSVASYKGFESSGYYLNFFVRSRLLHKYTSLMRIKHFHDEFVENLEDENVLPSKAPGPLDFVCQKSLREDIDNMLAGFTEREEKIIRLRFALYDGRMYTQNEIGKNFGFSGANVDRIEKKALRKFRHPERRSRLEDYHLPQHQRPIGQ